MIVGHRRPRPAWCGSRRPPGTRRASGDGAPPRSCVRAGQGQTLGMSAVTATARGFAAVGAAGLQPSRPAVRRRPQLAAGPALAAPAASTGAGGTFDYVAAHGAVVVAARHQAFSAAGTGSPVRRGLPRIPAPPGPWSKLPEPSGGRAAGVTALTAAGAGFTAAGTYGSDSDRVRGWACGRCARHGRPAPGWMTGGIPQVHRTGRPGGAERDHRAHRRRRHPDRRRLHRTANPAGADALAIADQVTGPSSSRPDPPS